MPEQEALQTKTPLIHRLLLVPWHAPAISESIIIVCITHELPLPSSLAFVAFSVNAELVRQDRPLQALAQSYLESKKN